MTTNVKEFRLTEKQIEANLLVASGCDHILFEGGSRCVGSDTILDGHTKTIKEQCEIGLPIEVITTRGKCIVDAPFQVGEGELLGFSFKSGKYIEVVPSHGFWDGKNWVYAEFIGVGSSVASRSSSPSLQESSLGIYLSKFSLGVQHLKKKFLNLMGDYLRYCYQYDEQLLVEVKDVPEYYASPSDDIEHTHIDHDIDSQMSELNNHTSHSSQHGGEYIHLDQSSYLPSKKDVLITSVYKLLFLIPFVLQIVLPILGSHLKSLPFRAYAYLQKSFLKVKDSVLHRYAVLFSHTYDKPLENGYDLDTVINIQKISKKNYYTVQVPVIEHFFANGILNHNSAKTFLHVRNTVLRALKASNSRHLMVRKTFSSIKRSIVMDTFPEVMRLVFPKCKYTLNKTDWYVKFGNGAEIWFGGLDDKERVEKILGNEYCTIFLNECSEISNSSRLIVLTRLAQKVYQDIVNGNGDRIILQNKMFYDCNPPSKAHWTYKIFHLKKDPDSKQGLPNPDNYQHIKMNPGDNVDNIAPGYIEKTLENMPSASKKRFLYGEYSDDNPNQLFSDVTIDENRVIDGEIPEFLRIVVACDPSGASDDPSESNDAIGIVAGALGTDGRAYLLQDNTVKAGPSTWGKITTDTYDNLKADIIVGEKNYGGEMVRFVIQTSKPNVPFKFVVATRGKHVRATPIAALYENGKVRHVGYFEELEEELLGFSTNGYTGSLSPNRADAWIWVLTELYAGIVSEDEEEEEYADYGNCVPLSWEGI